MTNDQVRIEFTKLDNEGNYCMLIDGKRIGYAVSCEDALLIGQWLRSALPEIEELFASPMTR